MSDCDETIKAMTKKLCDLDSENAELKKRVEDESQSRADAWKRLFVLEELLQEGLNIFTPSLATGSDGWRETKKHWLEKSKEALSPESDKK